MPAAATPGDADGPAGGPRHALTPADIDAVLADFRAWLLDLAADSGGLHPPIAGLEPEPVDLATLVGQLTGVRHEVNLLTRASRAQTEQASEALRLLDERTADLADRLTPPEDEEVSSALLQACVESADTLTRARRELQRLAGALAQLPAVTPAQESVYFPLVARWLGIDRVYAARAPVAPPADTGRVSELLTGTLAGLEMGLQRVERLLAAQGLEAVAVDGVPFDPDEMEVVEAGANPDPGGGRRIEEVRRGYRWQGRLLRAAQVRVLG